MMLSEAIEAVGRMISGYANSGSASKSYLGTIASMLCQYPRSIAIGCADPIKGVATTTHFMPTPADISAWCEPRFSDMAAKVKKQEEIREQFAERAKYEAERPPQMGDPVPAYCRANLFVPADTPKYAAMVERAATEHGRLSYVQPGRAGIWVPIGWYEDDKPSTKQWKQFSMADLHEIYGRHDAAEA